MQHVPTLTCNAAQCVENHRAEPTEGLLIASRVPQLKFHDRSHVWHLVQTHCPSNGALSQFGFVHLLTVKLVQLLLRGLLAHVGGP